MAETMEMKVIARIRSDFSSKFGIPRQSGLVESLRAEVVFAPEYRSPDAVRGLALYSHIWLVWGFSQAVREGWSATVRPPRLGGNERVGVFATRSPFRPNPIGLSCVRLLGVDLEAEEGPVLRVGGADLLDGSPIFDVKPYLPYVDAHPEASAALPCSGSRGRCAWTLRRICCAASRRTGVRRCWTCSPRTRAPAISTMPRASTAWNSAASTCASRWRTACSASGKSCRSPENLRREQGPALPRERGAFLRLRKN